MFLYGISLFHEPFLFSIYRSLTLVTSTLVDFEIFLYHVQGWLIHIVFAYEEIESEQCRINFLVFHLIVIKCVLELVQFVLCCLTDTYIPKCRVSVDTFKATVRNQFSLSEPLERAKLPVEFPRSRVDNGHKIFRETCTATVLYPPGCSSLFLHLRSRLLGPPFSDARARITSERKRKKRAKSEKKGKTREERGDRLLCDTRLPRIPKRRLSPLPLNIHSLGKADKNKEKARSTIPSRSFLSTLKIFLGGSARSAHAAPATRGSLFILEFILY